MKIGIVGYGNLGKAVEKLASANNNFEIVGIFSRRKISASSPVFSISEAPKFKGKIDVMLMCGGSEKDLMIQTPLFAKNFNTIDTFDTHQKTLKHFQNVNKTCQTHQTSSIICCGWDPGLFSVLRVLFSHIFENVNCFYGKGISLGHTNALKRIKGIIDAKQYTIENKRAVRQAQKNKPITVLKHIRKCFVVTNNNHKEIKNKIFSTPNYFKGEKTIVKFISQKSLVKKHSSLSHKGHIVCKSKTSSLELFLSMQSNPEFTANIMLCYATALSKIVKAKVFKAFTPMQIPVSWLFEEPINKLISTFC